MRCFSCGAAVDDQLKSEGDEEYEPERALVSARIALVDGGGRRAGAGLGSLFVRAAAQVVADAVALSVSDLARVERAPPNRRTRTVF